MSVRFNIKIAEKILRERGISEGGKVQQRLDSDVLAYCEEFVPKDSGELIASGRRGTKKGSGSICYTAPYAAYQYYGVSKNGKKLNYRGGGRRGAYWFERMKATSRYTLLKNAALAAGARAEEKTAAQKLSIPLWQRIYSPLTKQAQLKYFKARKGK